LVEKVIRGNEEPEDEEQIQLQANEIIQEILKMPMPEAYKLLLKDLRFDYMEMKDTTGKYKHHYSNCIQPNYIPSMTKMIRLASETADLAQALPYEHTNGIYCRCDKDRVDVMKAMVMGAKGTPYAHGAFVFDIFFEDNYPNGPPKCNLETTGGGKVRFNPNLYACGKVCLSLLGTWRGNATENWDAKLSTLMQILISVQAIIMSEAVYFNEPGFEGEANSKEGQNKNEAY
jgi:ubiquitin-protein ligase